jgi:hypothetical protein
VTLRTRKLSLYQTKPFWKQERGVPATVTDAGLNA